MDWSLIIGPILNLLLAKCFKSQGEQGDPQQYLKARYNPSTRSFDDATVNAAMRQTRKAIAHAKRDATKAERKTFPRYTPEQVKTMTVDRLRAAMNAPVPVVRSTMAMAATFHELEG